MKTTGTAALGLMLLIPLGFGAPHAAAQSIDDYRPQLEGSTHFQVPGALSADIEAPEAGGAELIQIRGKKPPKPPRGNLTLKQKASFKAEKFRLKGQKSKAKTEVKNATKLQKLANKELDAAARVANISRNRLNRKNDKLEAARTRAGNMTGLLGRLARARVNRMEKNYLKAEAKHAAGPKARHDAATTAVTTANFSKGVANQNLQEARQALVTRKDNKNAARADNLATATAKKIEKFNARGGKTPNITISAPVAVPKVRETQGRALFLTKPAATRSTMYGPAPTLPPATQAALSVPNVKDIHGHSKAPPPATAIYGPAPPAVNQN